MTILPNSKRVIAFALASALLLPASAGLLPSSTSQAEARGNSSAYCGSDSYVNSRGNCVHRPVQSVSVPAGASAQCRDGSYSFSQSRRGTCSHHGGVSRWL